MESWNGLGWNDLKSHPVPPHAVGRDTFHWTRALSPIQPGLGHCGKKNKTEVSCEGFLPKVLDFSSSRHPSSYLSLVFRVPSNPNLWFHVQVFCEFLCRGKPKVGIGARVVRDGHPRHPLFGWMEELPTSWGWPSASGDEQAVNRRHLLFHVTECVLPLKKFWQGIFCSCFSL